MRYRIAFLLFVGIFYNSLSIGEDLPIIKGQNPEMKFKDMTSLESFKNQAELQKYINEKSYVPIQIPGDSVRFIPRHMLNSPVGGQVLLGSPPMSAYGSWRSAYLPDQDTSRIIKLENKVDKLEALIKTQTQLIVELTKKIK